MLKPVLTCASGVGNSDDEHPLPLVRCADVGCSKQIPCRIEPERGKVRQDGSKSMSNKPRDILKENGLRLALIDDSGDVAPDPSFVVGSFSLSGAGEGLTGKPPTTRSTRPRHARASKVVRSDQIGAS